jgi:hypothetical protein
MGAVGAGRRRVGAMTPSALSLVLSPRYRFTLALLSLPLLAAAGIVLSALAPTSVSRYMGPTVTAILVFAAFSLALWRIVGENIFGEIGFLYLGFTLVYTLMPAFGFMLAGLDQLGPLGSLLPEPPKLITHLWRHVLFETAVAAGYLLLRARAVVPARVHPDDGRRDGRTLLVITTVLVLAIVSMELMSAPVSTYYEHFTRYDHLPWLQRKLMSLSLRLSLGLYCVLLTFLFRNYRKYRLILPLVVIAICTHEIVYSFGARIQALIILLQVLCLYHFMVRRVSLKAGFIACLVMAAVFSVVEAVRPLAADTEVSVTSLAEGGLKPASEFGAVFYPSFHLYEERNAHALPPVEWPMFFSDIIPLVTFGDFTRWNPMNWYASNYYPTVDIPPFTVGPIAESALWGGEPDLFVRGLVNGLFFAWIMRWFLRHRHRWWALTIYAYCYSTCILTIKYTVFLHVGLIEKNVLPTLALVYLTRILDLSLTRRKGGLPDGGSPLAAPLAGSRA